MDPKTIYIVATGTRWKFQDKLNEMSEQGFCICGNMNTSIGREGVFVYSQLMSKTETVKS